MTENSRNTRTTPKGFRTLRGKPMDRLCLATARALLASAGDPDEFSSRLDAVRSALAGVTNEGLSDERQA